MTQETETALCPVNVEPETTIESPSSEGPTPPEALPIYGPARYGMTNDTPQDFTRRLALLLCEILHGSQGGSGSFIELGRCDEPGQPRAEGVLYHLIETADSVFRGGLPWREEDTETPEECRQEEEKIAQFIRQQVRAGYIADDPFLCALHFLFKSYDAPTDAEARRNILRAFEFTLLHLRGMDDLPAAPPTEQGASAHASPELRKTWTARPSKSSRRRLRGH
jgi:hypothetical protein